MKYLLQAYFIAMVRQVDDFQEFQQLINGDAPVLIDFTATWCGPCQVIGPVFNTLAGNKKYEGITFIKVDVDQNEEASEHAEISCMPT